MKNQNTANKPKLHIVGHGAIGLLLAFYLRQYFDITLIVRNKKKHNETVLFTGQNNSLCEFTVTTVTFDEVKHIEQLIIPTKFDKEEDIPLTPRNQRGVIDIEIRSLLWIRQTI